MKFEIIEIKEYSPKLFEAFKNLLPQLVSEDFDLDNDYLELVVNSPSNRILVACANGVVLGGLTMVLVRIPTGNKVLIEDVVVDKSFRGHGIGEALVEEAVKLAQKLGVKKVDLTSSPFRETANRLYKRVGFEKRKTNVYRLNL
jgi:ribosomal protein S18 acetylase RimI-like enzyme